MLSPPYTDLVADPLPRLANRDSSWGASCSPYAFVAAWVRAANPAAEEARPAPVGASFSELMWAGVGFAASVRTSSRNCCTRFSVSPVWGFPFRVRVSSLFCGVSVTVVVVGNLFRVSERLLASGSTSCSSFLPQYFMSAMFGFARDVCLCLVVSRVVLPVAPVVLWVAVVCWLVFIVRVLLLARMFWRLRFRVVCV